MAIRNGNPSVQPGVPNVNDQSQPTAEEMSRRAEETRRMVQADMNKTEDERLAHDNEIAARDGRDGDIEAARGGRRSYVDDDFGARERGRTDPERRRFFQLRFNNAILPDLPQTEQLQRAWVSTTNNVDTPQWRLSMGWHFCKHEKLAAENWRADEYAVKDSRNIYAGCVMWREMIAMEIDRRIRFDYFREVHHDAPADQARQIYDTIEAAGERIRDAGGRTSMGPGMQELRDYVRAPTRFTG